MHEWHQMGQPRVGRHPAKHHRAAYGIEAIAEVKLNHHKVLMLLQHQAYSVDENGNAALHPDA